MPGVDTAKFDELVNAAFALDPQPRERRWVSLSLCIADAVWSIGAHYDNVWSRWYASSLKGSVSSSQRFR